MTDMRPKNTQSYLQTLAFIFAMFAVCAYTACSNSEGVDYVNYAEIANGNDIRSNSNISNTQETSSSSKVIDYLPLDDTEYPYAGIPRIVIETENHHAIKDRETEIPAKLQLWGEKTPESEVMDLTIRGRGNTSWTEMPKKSYKIEFEKKQSILGMPKDKDWALIANYADKTLMRNYVAYSLSSLLDLLYTPRCEFVELYLNNEYMGVYLLVETIKIAKNRIDIPKNDYSYIVEVDEKYKPDEQVFFSDILLGNKKKAFQIHEPKNASEESINTIKEFILDFETFLNSIKRDEKNDIEKWLDVDAAIMYYWLQEFSKNPDTGVYNGFLTSVYFTFVYGEKIKMGPIWDFDLAFGNHMNNDIKGTENWHIRKYWYSYLFTDSSFYDKASTFWINKRDIFGQSLNIVNRTRKKLSIAGKNNFKRWNILDSPTKWSEKCFSSYEAAVEDLEKWIKARIQWIDLNVKPVILYN